MLEQKLLSPVPLVTALSNKLRVVSLLRPQVDRQSRNALLDAPMQKACVGTSRYVPFLMDRFCAITALCPHHVCCGCYLKTMKCSHIIFLPSCLGCWQFKGWSSIMCDTWTKTAMSRHFRPTVIKARNRNQQSCSSGWVRVQFLTLTNVGQSWKCGSWEY